MARSEAKAAGSLGLILSSFMHCLLYRRGLGLTGCFCPKPIRNITLLLGPLPGTFVTHVSTGRSTAAERFWRKTDSGVAGRIANVLERTDPCPHARAWAHA